MSEIEEGTYTITLKKDKGQEPKAIHILKGKDVYWTLPEDENKDQKTSVISQGGTKKKRRKSRARKSKSMRKK